jgi:hypothetical protein
MQKHLAITYRESKQILKEKNDKQSAAKRRLVKDMRGVLLKVVVRIEVKGQLTVTIYGDKNKNIFGSYGLLVFLFLGRPI